MLCKRITVSDWDSWFGNSLHDSVKKYQMSDYFQNNNFVVEAAKVSSTAMQKKIRRKRRRRRERSTGGVFMEPVPLRAVATNPPDDDDKTTHTHTHTHIDESGLGLRRCISTQVGLHGEPRLTLPTLPTTNSISTPRSSESVDDGFVQYWAASPTRPETLIHSSPPTPSGRGRQTGQLARGLHN